MSSSLWGLAVALWLLGAEVAPLLTVVLVVVVVLALAQRSVLGRSRVSARSGPIRRRAWRQWPSASIAST
ncbi:MAG TPA: hypothetical protein VK585_07140 [Jiangellaceae bacterium]|nr:hypothetical protein [Jiangellaceae bacterium]